MFCEEIGGEKKKGTHQEGGRVSERIRNTVKQKSAPKEEMKQ